MLNNTELEKEFMLAIETFNVNKVEELLNKGINANITNDNKSWFVTFEIFERMSNINKDMNKDINKAEQIILLLLENGLNLEFESQYIEVALNYIIGWNAYNTSLNLHKFILKIEKTLLFYGANPNVGNSDGSRAICCTISESRDNNTESSELLLKHGAIIHMEEYPDCFALIKAASQNKKNLIKLLLDYGADTAIEDYDASTALELLEINKLFNTPKKLLEGFKSLFKDKSLKDLLSNDSEEADKMEEEMILDDSNDIKLNKDEYQELQILLNPNNPPYLKLGESEEDKYIIYENKKTDEEYKIYLLADKKQHKEKNYLYADNKIDLFLYWCYKHELLIESVMKAIKIYEDTLEEINTKNIHNLMTSTLGEELTTDYFNKEGKDFATSYLTVTHWWYNLHTDFNRLYQEEDNKLPRSIQSQEEFDTLLKLLDIRFEQFKSGKDYNSNQNKEELECLIQGIEPRPRHIQLAEQLNEMTTEVSVEEKKVSDNIIPDDFMS